VYSRPVATDQLGTDFDAAGHIDTALLKKLGVSPNSDFYLCGPSSFLRNMYDGLRDWRVPAEQVHTEVFGPLQAVTPGLERVDRTPHEPQGPPGSGPSVSFARSGITVEWDRRFDSVGRGVRRSGPMVVSDWSVPHVYYWPDCRIGSLSPRASRETNSGKRARVLLTARGEHHS